MGKKVTIGGDRVGSGKKMQAELHNYYRSTHNLSEKWASTMGSGILYPALVKPAMRGDAFDIEIEADARTIPTKGPLFGSYKMQVDVYQCPIRLYQGILHNNPLAIGLNMSQVKFPKLVVTTQSVTKGTDHGENGKFADNSLLKYLGMSGIGACETSNTSYLRKINALPALMYYDIFKTYYANKQEDKAYVISSDKEYKLINGISAKYTNDPASNIPIDEEIATDKLTETIVIYLEDLKLFSTWNNGTNPIMHIGTMQAGGVDGETEISINYEDITWNTDGIGSKVETDTFGAIYATLYPSENKIVCTFTYNSPAEVGRLNMFCVDAPSAYKYIDLPFSLVPFDLQNIDDMRYDLLSSNRLGVTFEIQASDTYLPYSKLVETDEQDITLNQQPMNGLVVKTYQNDIFNNWLNTEWIEGENGINELTKVAIVDGAFSMDALNFATKLYNMLNRIAVAGGTYEDWQDVVYEEVKRRQIESPIFVGGISQEIVFDEIVQTAPADGDPLGTLGGRGRLNGKKKGGKMHIKCDEACFIIAIVSLTPRIFYTQGNEFYMTELDSLDDLHKPAMDGIGFQDLIGERMAYWDTILDDEGNIQHRSKIGKLPAWIEYMTSVDKAFGDFANETNGFMILNRRYELDEETGGIKDATTYIDPSKYNYAFAYTALDAQNFWVEIGFNIKARRLMSARLIPSV